MLRNCQHSKIKQIMNTNKNYLHYNIHRIGACLIHLQTQTKNTWHSPRSPKVYNKNTTSLHFIHLPIFYCYIIIITKSLIMLAYTTMCLLTLISINMLLHFFKSGYFLFHSIFKVQNLFVISSKEGIMLFVRELHDWFTNKHT